MTEIVSDIDRALGLMCAVQGDVDDIRYLKMLGDPASKARPRFGKGGVTYTPAESRKAEKRTADFLRNFYPEPMTGNVALVAIFFRSNRQRIDADNLLKHVCDAANGIVWQDDSQVTSVTGIVELDPACPRTLFAISPHISSMTRGTDAVLTCHTCDGLFPLGGRKAQRFCSTACAYAARVNVREPIPCRQCGKPFRRTTNRQILCSPDCRVEWLRDRNRAGARPPSNCTECGALLTHKRGGRCRDCWRRNPHRIPAEQPQPLPERNGTTYLEGTLPL